MRAERARLIAAGKLLTSLPEGASVQSVRVDGRDVDAAAARAAFLEAEEKARERSESAGPTRLDALSDRFEGRIEKIEEKLSSHRLGKRALERLQKEPKVETEHQVEVHLASGDRIEAPVTVLDRKTTLVLTNLSLGVNIAAMTPLVGRFVPGVGAIAAGVAAFVCVSGGKPELGIALQEIAKRQLVLTGTAFVPLMKSATNAYAAYQSDELRRELRRDPTVATIRED